jgi:pimeloyl-ACP methyl ester carboxylesterase
MMIWRAPLSRRRRRLTALLAALGMALAGCSADEPLNPSFALTVKDARAALKQMDAVQVAPERPIVVIGGIFDPGLICSKLARDLRRATHPHAPILCVSSALPRSFDHDRQRVIEAVEAAFPCGDPALTTEVDVVAISMGGLIARHAALPARDGQKRLRIRRLFTICTPHRGAALAGVGFFDPRCQDMKCGSAFLARLDEGLHDPPAFELYCYGRLGDATVGVHNTAPAGRTPWWVQSIPLQLAHGGASCDPRIIADIARRVRGEEPLTTSPPAPIPD